MSTMSLKYVMSSISIKFTFSITNQLKIHWFIIAIVHRIVQRFSQSYLWMFGSFSNKYVDFHCFCDSDNINNTQTHTFRLWHRCNLYFYDDCSSYLKTKMQKFFIWISLFRTRWANWCKVRLTCKVCCIVWFNYMHRFFILSVSSVLAKQAFGKYSFACWFVLTLH